MLVLASAVIEQPWLSRIVFVANGLTMMASARANLHDRSNPSSDGSQIRRIQEQPLDAQRRDSNAITSSPPPGY
jgi:hypothetical protein